MSVAGALREALNAPRAAEEERHCQEVLATARAAVPPDAFEAAWAEGRAMTLDETVAYALDGVASTR